MALAGIGGNYVSGANPDQILQAFNANQAGNLGSTSYGGGSLGQIANLGFGTFSGAGGYPQTSYGMGQMLQNLGGFGGFGGMAGIPAADVASQAPITDPTAQTSQFGNTQAPQPATDAPGVSLQQIAGNTGAQSNARADAAAEAQGQPPPGPTATPGGGTVGTGGPSGGGQSLMDPNLAGGQTTKFQQGTPNVATPTMRGTADQGGIGPYSAAERAQLYAQGQQMMNPATTPQPPGAATGGQDGQTLDDIIQGWRDRGEVPPAAPDTGGGGDDIPPVHTHPSITLLPSAGGGAAVPNRGQQPGPGEPIPYTGPTPGQPGYNEDMQWDPRGQFRGGPGPGQQPGQGNPQTPVTNAMGGPQALQQFLQNAMRGAMMGGPPPWYRGRGVPPWMRGRMGGPYGMGPQMPGVRGPFGMRSPRGPFGGPGMPGQMGRPVQQGSQPGQPPGSPGGPSPAPAAPSGPTTPPGVPTQGLMQGVKHFEHFSPKSYWDAHQWSNGYGTRARFPGETIDVGEADRRLKVELGMASKQVDGIVPPATPQNVRDALTSFSFNVGTGWMKNSQLAQAVKGGNWNNAAQIMQQYVRSNGRVLPGLVTRRRAEAEFMLMPPRATSGAAPTQGSNTPGVISL